MGSSADKGRKYPSYVRSFGYSSELGQRDSFVDQRRYFQQANGIAWKEAQLAKKLDSSVLAQLIHEAGNRVDGVKSVDSVDITEFDEETRTLHGEITITTERDETVFFCVLKNYGSNHF